MTCRRASSALALAAWALLAPVAQGSAQQIRGLVLDADTERPLSGATVTLEPEEAGAVSVPRSRVPATLVLRATTGQDGSYAFAGIPGGQYVLRVERIGYRTAVVEVLLRGGTPHLTLALDVEPVEMERLVVTADARTPGRTTPGLAPVDDAEAGEAVRRGRFLEPDVRLFTEDDLAVPSGFAEADLLRALQRVPGMGTRDEFSAELWTRGGGWGQTRVYLDDLPLFHPLFAGGALTALGPSAVGAVFLHPGARPVSIGDGTAGVVRMGTRAAEKHEGLPFLGEASLGSVQGMTEGRFLNGQAGVLAYARRSWFDRLWNGFVDDGHDPEGPFDYRVSSSLVRLDGVVGDGVEFVASTFRARDDLDGNVAALVTASRGTVRDGVDQGSVSLPAFGHRVRIVAGRSTHRAEVGAAPERPLPQVDPDVVTLRPGSVALVHDQVRVEMEPAVASRLGTSAGAEFTRQMLDAGGAAAAGRVEGASAAPAPPATATTFAAWAGRRVRLGRMVEIEGGVRAEVGFPHAEAERVRLAPHLAVRVEPAPDLWVTLAGRISHQGLQEVAPAGTRFGAGHTLLRAWTLAGPHGPLARAGILTVGLERRVAAGWWLNADAWRRDVGGVAVLDPSVGVFPIAPIRWRKARNEARGFELQLRRLAGPVTGALGYAWLRSTDVVGEARHPSAADRRHGFDGHVRWSVTPSLGVTSSFEAYSGAPDTRSVTDACVDRRGGSPPCATAPETTAWGPPGGLRGPGFASLDLGVDWVHRGASWGLAISVQVRNVLGRDNRGGYLGSTCPDGSGGSVCLASGDVEDRYQPLDWLHAPIPLLALRVWF